MNLHTAQHLHRQLDCPSPWRSCRLQCRLLRQTQRRARTCTVQPKCLTDGKGSVVAFGEGLFGRTSLSHLRTHIDYGRIQTVPMKQRQFTNKTELQMRNAVTVCSHPSVLKCSVHLQTVLLIRRASQKRKSSLGTPILHLFDPKDVVFSFLKLSGHLIGKAEGSC
jgi:hypothetical protein